MSIYQRLVNSIVRLCVTFFLIGITIGLFIPFSWFFSIWAYRNERDQRTVKQVFIKNRPFFRYGVLTIDQSIAFTDKMPRKNREAENTVLKIIQQVTQKLPKSMIRNSYALAIRPVTITDKAAPRTRYEKEFIEISAETPLETRITVLYNVMSINKNIFIRWWVLLRGRITRWQVIRFVFFSPFTIVGWGIPRARGNYSVRARIASDIQYTYDVFDIETWLQVFQQNVFDRLIQQLDSKGFDVEFYKLNPINYIGNQISISGTGNQVGTITQNNNSQATSNQGNMATPPTSTQLPRITEAISEEDELLENFDEGDESPTVASIDEDNRGEISDILNAELNAGYSAKKKELSQDIQLGLFRDLYSYADTIVDQARKDNFFDTVDSLREEVQQKNPTERKLQKVIKSLMDQAEPEVFIRTINALLSKEADFPPIVQNIAAQAKEFYARLQLMDRSKR